MTPKVEPKVSKWRPQMTKIRSKIDKMPVPELVLKNAGKNDETPCLWILKNSGFAWEGLHFSRFPLSSKSWENYSRNCLNVSSTFLKQLFGGFAKTQFRNERENTENLMKQAPKMRPTKGHFLMIVGAFFR